MRLKIWGPNLPYNKHGDYHVHAADCADLKRGIYRTFRENSDQGGYVEDHDSVQSVVESMFGDVMDEDEDRTWEDYSHEMHFFPCTDGLTYRDE